jgi:DNA polymerase IV (DinB-like DNA polymerase)
MRQILHIDLDYFYAQLEMKRNPKLRKKPVVVCMFSGRSEDSGAVATASYEARELGIHAGMPIIQAKRLGKEAIFLPADREHYSRVSERIMDILQEYDEDLEQVSIDEAYLDISNRNPGNLAKEIKDKIKQQEGLTCSIGIGPNKLIAKMASGTNKPDGLTIVKENEIRGFLKDLPVKKLFSVGPKTEKELNDLGVKTIGDLAKFPKEKLVQMFGGKRGRDLHNYANGIDERPVEPREKQQLSRLASLKEDTDDVDKVKDLLRSLSKSLYERTKKEGVTFKTITFHAIDNRLQMYSRSRTIDESKDLKAIEKTGEKLAEEFLKENPDIILRRIGIRVSNLSRSRKQKSLGEF